MRLVPELDLERAPALASIDDRVDLEPGLVTVVVHRTVERLSVDPQIPHDERLEQQPEEAQIKRAACP